MISLRLSTRPGWSSHTFIGRKIKRSKINVSMFLHQLVEDRTPILIYCSHCWRAVAGKHTKSIKHLISMAVERPENDSIQTSHPAPVLSKCCAGTCPRLTPGRAECFIPLR